MPGGLGLRFAVEAAFIVAVAVLTIVANFSWRGISLTMLVAWVLIAAVEWATSRRRPVAVEPSPDALEAARAAAPPEPSAPRQRQRQPRREPWRPRVRRPASPMPPTPQPRVPDEVELPQHVRVLTPEPPPEPEPEPEQPVRPPLVAVPTPRPPVPEPPPEPTPEPVPPPEPAVVSLASIDTRPREWNLWELERAARDSAGADPERDEERNYLLMYLREFASSNGVLPLDFDALVRESFGDVLAAMQPQ